jgi:hypothetical protein
MNVKSKIFCITFYPKNKPKNMFSRKGRVYSLKEGLQLRSKQLGGMYGDN